MSSSRTSKVIALSLGQGLTTVVSLVSGMVMARILSQTELATYRQTFLAYDIALPLLSLGISQGIYYFLPTEKTRARGLVVDGLIMMVTMGLLYAVFIALGGNHLLAKRFSNPAIVNTLVYLLPLPIVMLPAGLLASVMVVQNRINKLTVYNVLSSLLMASSVIVGCLVWKTPEAMTLVKVGISIVTGLVAIMLIVQSVPKDDWLPQLSNMKIMLRFSIPLVLAGALGTISLQLDKIIVSAMCSPEDFAVYSTGAVEIPLLGVLTGSIMSVILPDLRRLGALNDGRGALALFRHAASKSAVFMMPLMVFLLVSAESFILTLFSAKYSGSVLPFRMYLLMLPMRIVLFGSFLMAFGLNKNILYRAFVGLVANGVLSVILVRYMGYNGAILATILSVYFVEGFWNFATISRLAKCKWYDVMPLRLMGQLIGLSVLASIPIVLLEKMNIQLIPAARLGINGAIFLIVLPLLAWVMQIEIVKQEIIFVCAKGKKWLTKMGSARQL